MRQFWTGWTGRRRKRSGSRASRYSSVASVWLPDGRCRNTLEAAFADLLSQDLEDRVLPFDVDAAAQAALLAAARQRAGRPVDIRDTQIAAIAQARRATLATRNVRHFEGLSVPVVNPWG